MAVTDRTIKLWDACRATRTSTFLRLEKVLSRQNPHIPEGYIEVVFSTPDKSDLENLLKACSSNLMLDGNTQQVLYDIRLVSDVAYHNGRYFFTVSAEHWV